MTIPILETERLILRGYRMEDFPAYAEMWGDAAVTKFIGGKPMTEEEAWSRFLRGLGQWHALGYGGWAVEQKTSGRLIGDVGFIEAKRAIAPPLKGIPEMGWAFSPLVHGNGYAFESARAARNWGDEYFGKVAMRCIIDIENHPSHRLAEKLGFVELLRTTYRGDPVVMRERKA
jgi:RimJ/RimL family protein N-acetyltransferase